MLNVAFECCARAGHSDPQIYGELFVAMCSCRARRISISIDPVDGDSFDVYLMNVTAAAGGRRIAQTHSKTTGPLRLSYEEVSTDDGEALVIAINRSLLLNTAHASPLLDLELTMDINEPYALFGRLYRESCYETIPSGAFRSASRARHIATLLHAMTTDDHVFDAWPGAMYQLRVRMTVALERFVNRLRVYTLSAEMIDCALGEGRCELHRITSHPSMEFHLRYKSRGTLLGFVRAIEYDFCLNDHYSPFMQNCEFLNVRQIVGENECRLFV